MAWGWPMSLTLRTFSRTLRQLRRHQHPPLKARGRRAPADDKKCAGRHPSLEGRRHGRSFNTTTGEEKKGSCCCMRSGWRSLLLHHYCLELEPPQHRPSEACGWQKKDTSKPQVRNRRQLFLTSTKRGSAAVDRQQKICRLNTIHQAGVRYHHSGAAATIIGRRAPLT